MKKYISAILAVSLAFTAVPISTYAVDEIYIPSVYFRADGEEFANSTDSITIDKQSIGEEVYTLTVNVYIADESLTARWVSPKWKCAEKDYIKISDVKDPKSPLIPFAYAETDDDGNLISGEYSSIVSIDSNYNTSAITVKYQKLGLSEALPMIPYGEKSDSYPLTSFDVEISPDIPVGNYEIYFLTEAEDYEDQRISEVYMCVEGKSIKAFPNVSSLNISITDDNGFTLGDIDNDGKIDSSDASIALADYANTSTGKKSELTDLQKKSADVNGDNRVDAIDASVILMYYAYLSTTGDKEILPITEFI